VDKNFSVEHTARHGADAGYEVVVATDGTSTIDDTCKCGTKFRSQNIADRLSAKKSFAP